MKKYKFESNKIVELDNQKIRIIKYENAEYGLEIRGNPLIAFLASDNEDKSYKDFLKELFDSYVESEFNNERKFGIV